MFNRIPSLTLSDGRTLLNVTLADLAALDVPQADIDAALLALRIKELKAICKARIYAQATVETQANMTFAVAFIGSKTVAQRSAEEQAILAKAPAVLDWVSAMRTNVQTLAADAALNPHDDANWPAIPQDALDLAAMF